MIFDDDLKKLYVNLEKKSKILTKFKWGIIVLTSIIVFLVTFSVDIFDVRIKEFELLFSFSLSVFTSGIINLIAFIFILKQFPKINTSVSFKSLGYLIISPDLFFSNIFKKSFLNINRKSKSIKNKFIEYGTNNTLYNWNRYKILNKYFIIYTCSFHFYLAFLYLITTVALSESYENLLCYFFIFRLLSRSVQVVNALYLDVVSTKDKLFIKESVLDYRNEDYYFKWNNSFLLRDKRLALILHTFIEMIILFGIVHYLKQPIILSNILDALLYSASISVFNTSYSPSDSLTTRVIFCYQIFTSVIILLLSLAHYVGKENEVNSDEKSNYQSMYSEYKSKNKNNWFKPNF